MRWLVVGGGTAGCVVAAALSDVASDHVTLLEAGGGDGRRLTGASSLADLAVDGAVWADVRPYVQGRGVGGSSRINGAVLSGDGIDLLPSETATDAELGPIDRALLAAAQDARPAVLARRGGRLLSAADIFLAPVRDRPNVEVVDGAEVRSVRFDGRRAVGVTLADGSTVDGDAVVLSAGAVRSPVLLMRSGVEAPGLGDLTDHPSRVVDLALEDTAIVGTEQLVTGAVLRRTGAEIVSLNHVGAGAPGRGALAVGVLGHRRHGRVTVDADGEVRLWFDPLDADAAGALGDAVNLAINLIDTRPFRGVVAGWRISDGVGYFHATSSCRSVVDHAGAVSGREGLFVADSSTLELPASGLYAPTVAHASRVALGRFGLR